MKVVMVFDAQEITICTGGEISPFPWASWPLYESGFIYVCRYRWVTLISSCHGILGVEMAGVLCVLCWLGATQRGVPIAANTLCCCSLCDPGEQPLQPPTLQVPLWSGLLLSAQDIAGCSRLFKVDLTPSSCQADFTKPLFWETSCQLGILLNFQSWYVCIGNCVGFFHCCAANEGHCPHFELPATVCGRQCTIL